MSSGASGEPVVASVRSSRHPGHLRAHHAGFDEAHPDALAGKLLAEGLT